ncbi:Ferric reduction oxidase 8, mitochondrial [Vitis vinifera]|uniref:Ferric reduction oxidase 8, mitochondrial n=1 Tax=Vitis vinifera TaxID=29760 RepID=A0A438EYV1_VITVI|nr:Ferric reduction oxidase 8, mitochondrial [Vitis vinifera]
MAKATLLILKLLMILICAGWITLWILKPTQLWTKKWHTAEDSARTTVFGYYGLNFVVYTFPVIALAAIDLFTWICSLESQEEALEILAVSLFFLYLAWTFYVHISNDFEKMVPAKSLKSYSTISNAGKKMTPAESLKLNTRQFKFLRVATRFGLLAEACLALLLLPVLRGMALFRTLIVWGIKDRIQDEMGKWQKTGRIYLAGEIALVTGLVIWITSLPPIRRKRFEIFYYTHHLYIVFLLFFLFHGGDRHFYMVFARVFPCKAIELVVAKDPGLKYAPTSIIFMKIPSISRFQWHSFSITSSSNIDDNTMSVIIKCGGWWTDSLSDIIHAELDSGSNQMKCIPIAIEGPYGPASLDFLSYESLLLNQSAEQWHLKLKVFVTQEEECGATIRDLLNEFCQVQVVNFASKCSSYAANGLENLLWMAAMAGFSSVMFLVFLSSLNHAFLPSQDKSSKEKSPSWVADILLICSFIIAVLCSTIVAIVLRWRKLRREIPPVSQKEGKAKEGLMDTRGTALEEHEIHFGGRPNFQVSKETGGSNIGVLVCGPETMKESVASICSQTSQCCNMGSDQKRKSHFSFHSLNFTL